MKNHPFYHPDSQASHTEQQDRINTLLDDIVESYSGPALINNLETYALPNRRAVIEAFTHIQHLLFLGFFSTRPLERATLRLAIAEHLLPAKEILTEQIRRACNWQERNQPQNNRKACTWCRDTTEEFLAKIPELRAILYEDIESIYERDPAAYSIEEVVFSYPGVLAITAHRIAHLWHKAGVPMLPRILSEFAHTRTGIDIHPGAQIGKRFFIDHGTGTVIGATSIIGDNVTLYHGVPLGALSVGPTTPKDTVLPNKRHPTIGDNVTIYAGSTILGGETVVGDNSVIGGNVWLLKSVPPNSKIYHSPK